jgi:hypothetical protein
MTATQARIAKLPKWAQQHIELLEAQLVPAAAVLDRQRVLENLAGDLLAKFELEDGSAAASLAYQIRATLAELAALSKGKAAGSGIDELAGRRDERKTARRKKAPGNRSHGRKPAK